MRRPAALPPSLAERAAFGAREARRHGVPRARLGASDLSTPYRGVRRRRDATPTRLELVQAFSERMTPHQFISHSTAALLNEVPLPLALESDTRLHISVLRGAAIPRGRGVVGHRLDPERAGILVAHGIPMTDAPTTWCQLAALVGLDDLVAAGDFLITGGEPISGRPRTATVRMLADATELHRGSPGAAVMRAALPLLRRGPLSRRETLLRLRMLRAGLPEPSLNLAVPEAMHDSRVPIVDLAYLEYRIAMEYEGDHHRNPDQFRRDIRRYEALQDAGWIVIRFTADDVPDDPHAGATEVVDRIAARLRSRGWRR